MGRVAEDGIGSLATASPHDGTERSPGECRSLVATIRRDSSSHPAERPRAGFVAQLIANDRRLPAYRTARLAEPGAATVSYARIAGSPVRVVDCMV